MIELIRYICSHELGCPRDYPFFNVDYLEGESPDDALLRLFYAERRHHANDLDTVLVMCHG